MKRYETAAIEGTLYLEAPDGAEGHPEADPDGWLEIGPLDAVVDAIGGETYELEYDERQRTVGWLDTDEDGVLSFDVRETLRSVDFDDEFVENVAGVPADETNADGESARAAVFADLVTTIWDSKGNLDAE